MTTTISIFLVRPCGRPRLRQQLVFPPEIKTPSWALLKEAWEDQVKASWGPSVCDLVYKTSEASAEIVAHEEVYKEIMSQLQSHAREIEFELNNEHPENPSTQRASSLGFPTLETKLSNAETQLQLDYEQAVLHAEKAFAPSKKLTHAQCLQQQREHPMYNGRPGLKQRGPMLAVFHRAFARFTASMLLSKDEVAELLGPNDYRHASAFMIAACIVYHSEAARWEALTPLLAACLGQKMIFRTSHCHSAPSSSDSEPESGAATDGTGFLQLDDGSLLPWLIVEYSNKHGQASIQTGLVARKVFADEEYADLRNGSVCPAILISQMDTYLEVSGFVFADMAIQETLTDRMDLSSSHLPEKCTRVAQTFRAVRNAFDEINSFYRSQYAPSPFFQPAPRLPCWTSFCDGAYDLRYLGRVLSIEEKPSRGLYYAEVVSCPEGSELAEGHHVVVKFADTYSERAHRVLAAAGLAPRLHHCKRIEGGQIMVVMDLVDGYPATKHKQTLPQTVKEDVRRAIEHLHNQGLVFGDLRRPNIMILKGRDEAVRTADDQHPAGRSSSSIPYQPATIGHAMLIDFDWAGEDGSGRYPSKMNTKEIIWADGAEPWELLKKEHDEFMLARL